MKPADAARMFLIGGRRAHLCTGADCDCVAELEKVIERQRELAVRAHVRARLAKPRIADALEETRNAIRRRA